MLFDYSSWYVITFQNIKQMYILGNVKARISIFQIRLCIHSALLFLTYFSATLNADNFHIDFYKIIVCVSLEA